MSGRNTKSTKKKVAIRPQVAGHANEFEAIDFIEKSWPIRPNPEIRAAFLLIRKAIIKCRTAAPSRKPSESWPPAKEALGPRYFDPLDLVRRVLMAHDLLFLSRQVTYHIAASAELPDVWADADQAHILFSRLVEHIARRAARGSRISITFKPFALRGGPGIEIGFMGVDNHLEDIEAQTFLTEIFQERSDAVSGVSLSDCRKIAMHQQGQLWVDFPKIRRPLYHLVLPASERPIHVEHAANQTFKYDISISNFADIRKRFGLKKSSALVTQIERSVRSLVRYPIDIVLAMTDKGMVTTIYEAQGGAAQSVASRISQRLGGEKFHIGKNPVEVSFSYHLTSLQASPIKS